MSFKHFTFNKRDVNVDKNVEGKGAKFYEFSFLNIFRKLHITKFCT